MNFWRDRRPAGLRQKEGKYRASVASSQRKQGISPEVSHALAGMTCISPQGEKSNIDRLT
ncbi:hypothetical protein GMF55_24225 [Salmonella enterica]|nr:hypothetical protein [Salmonella enterica]